MMLPRIVPPETAITKPAESADAKSSASRQPKKAPTATISFSLVNSKPVDPPAAPTIRGNKINEFIAQSYPREATFPRLNVLAPPISRARRTVSLETTEANWVLDQRRQVMKQREHYRYHSAWQKPFYGSAAEKEAYRREVREVLKDQMSGKMERERTMMIDKVQESQQAAKYDKKCLDDDKQDYVKKSTYLRQFRDENKKLMEWKENQNRENRNLHKVYERELLTYNPINWSCSLR